MKWLLAMLRESRGSRGRLLFFTACIAIGVAAVVGVAAMAGTIEQGLRLQARDLLAADLKVGSRRPIDPAVEAMVAEAGAPEFTRTREFASMVAPVEDGEAGESRLALVKSVDGRFPYYGTMRLEPPGLLADALAKGVVVAPELGVAPGGRLRVGANVLDVVAVVHEEPQRFGFMSMLGPRVFVHPDALKDSGLLGFGSRVRYELLVRMPDGDVRALEKRIEADAPGREHLSIETWRAGQPRVRVAVSRVERYLGLVALLSLVLGGIGVAQIVRAWIASRTPSIAILRCLGMRPREILALFLGQVGVLALAGSVVGALAGSLLPLAFADVARDLLRADVMSGGALFQPAAIARGLLLGVGIAVLFSLPALTAVWRVSPARVLRNEAEPLPAPAWIRRGSFAVLLAGLFSMAWVQGDRLDHAAVFTVGFLALAGVLTAGARLVMHWTGRIPRERLHPYLAQGLSALARPGAGTTGGIVALGLGVTVVLSMAIVERELSSGILGAVPATAPTVFLVDVQPDQWEGVRAEFDAHGATGVQSAAVVMARLRAINGRGVEEIAEERGGRARWTLTREQRMAPLPELPEDNVVVEGTLWGDPDPREISLEVDYAERMGVKLGDRLRMDVQGVPIEFKLTSLRRVEWRSFSLNFFVAVEPGSLAGAPRFRFAAARVPADREQALQDRLAASYPNVTMIRVRPILEQVVALLDKLAIGVRALGAFTVLAGLAILAGAISASTLRRRREAALLKTLGATRRGVGALFVTEYGLLGAVAGLLGSIGALLLAWGFLSGVAELEFGWPLATIPAAALAAGVLSAGCGILASLHALRAPPRESLRG